ncbi:MAG TPA: hypothetical protein VK826_13885, partial [Bacteroidia bacterium]|nr:hypothetical protein [Bacteroidia bacterium]
MKPVHPILKIATVTVFVTLMSGFVAYRAGAFEQLMYGDATTSNSGEEYGFSDSPGKDSVAPEMMAPSSKAMILIDEPRPVKKDTTKKNTQSDSGSRQNNNAPQNTNANPEPRENKPVYMGGSKSAPVFHP